MASGDTMGSESAPVVDYWCSPWIISSQRAAELYDAGVKLWRKEDLLDIETQLAQSYTLKTFTVRRIDGTVVHLKNPMYGVQEPIWEPFVKFREYWELVRSQPQEPSETYNCTYFIQWENVSIRNYQGPVWNARDLFHKVRAKWEVSTTCVAFKSRIHDMLSDKNRNQKTITKIVCFGLGDMHRKPADVWSIRNEKLPEEKRQPETAIIEGALIHHAIAITLAEVVDSYPQGKGVRLLTQDPGYVDMTKSILQDAGRFEFVGKYGAAGFTELDDESILFAPFVNGPMSQIITEIARPIMMICPKVLHTRVFDCNRELYGNPESPRTKKMWQRYENWNFPFTSDSAELKGSLDKLQICGRIDGQIISIE